VVTSFCGFIEGITEFIEPKKGISDEKVPVDLPVAHIPDGCRV
jgi:hypothetical protein